MLRCGFYEKEMTPPLGCPIPGYFKERIGDDVKDKLFAKAIVVDNGTTTIAILAIDAIGTSSQLHDEVTKRIEEYIGLKPENVMICATHTHTGIPVALRKGQKTDKAYIDMLCRLAADCVILAYKRLDKATAKYAKGIVDSISFVRNYKMKDGTIRTNPGRKNPDIVAPYSEIDPDLSILYFEDENNKPIGAIINFACHHDCVGGTGISGDYSSILSYELKKTYGDDFISVFVSGACGNINHIDVNSEHEPEHYKKMGKILATEAIKVIKEATILPNEKITSNKQYIKIKTRVPSDLELEEAKKVVKNYKERQTGGGDHNLDLLTEIKLPLSKRLLEYYEDMPSEYEVCLQTIGIGDCIFYVFPGEVFTQFGQYIKEHSSTSNNFIVTLANGTYYGYIPVKELFLPTVYEASPAGKLTPEAGYIMADKLLDMAQEQ